MAQRLLDGEGLGTWEEIVRELECVVGDHETSCPRRWRLTALSFRITNNLSYQIGPLGSIRSVAKARFVMPMQGYELAASNLWTSPSPRTHDAPGYPTSFCDWPLAPRWTSRHGQ
jgi:hypothetical protein